MATIKTTDGREYQHHDYVSAVDALAEVIDAGQRFHLGETTETSDGGRQDVLSSDDDETVLATLIW